MHPLTHPLPVTEHVSLLDVGYLTPARATNSGLNSKKTDAKSVFLRPDSDLLSNECPTLNSQPYARCCVKTSSRMRNWALQKINLLTIS